MSAASAIEWTGRTWNPLVGCSIKSPGCHHCYAAVMAKRLRAMAIADIAAGRDPGRKRHYIDAVDQAGRWTGNLIPVPEAVGDPLSWRKPQTVFVNSMSDLFHEDVPFDFIDRVFAAMALSPRHTYQVLTKRPERAAEYLSPSWRCDRVSDAQIEINGGGNLPVDPHFGTWPLPNVHLGTSVERQKELDQRIPHLLRTPAAVRFLSCEPLLGPLEFSDVGRRSDAVSQLGKKALSGIDWVIVGGESGPGARPCSLDWIRSIVQQCRAAGVPCFVKQLGAEVRMTFNEWNDLTDGGSRGSDRFVLDDQGELGTWRPIDPKGGDMGEWPEDVRVRETPTAVAA